MEQNDFRPPDEILRQKTILVIDDDPDVVFTTTLMLEDTGYRVLSGSTAADANSMTRKHRPAIVLLDVELPDGNGIEEAKKIKADPELDDVFVVLLSGSRISPEEQALGLRSGRADAYIIRPFTRVDFIARIEAFLRVRAYQELLRTKNAELERFTYTVSHDLKSPLLTINGFVDILENDLDVSSRESVQESLTHIRSATVKMNTLLTDLLKLSRTGNVIYTQEMVSMKDVAEQAVAAVYGLQAEQVIDWHISDSLPAVMGDRERLTEMMQNLVENAIKYMGEQATPRIEIGVAESKHGKSCYVRDNGQGIPKDFQSKVFELFERLHTDDRGTGVGLALVKRIIERHDGHIWIESEGEGKGTTFWFTLPWNKDLGVVCQN